MNYLVQAIIVIISFNYVRTEVEERCQLSPNISLECANNSVITINSTGTNNSQGNLWLGIHLKDELQALDIASNVCTFEYSCCDTNSSNEPPQLKIGYKLSTLLKSYNVTIVGELVITVPELASRECDQNSFENWITSNFTASEEESTTTESSTSPEPSTAPESSTSLEPSTATEASTSPEPSTAPESSTSLEPSTVPESSTTPASTTTTNSSTSTTATLGIWTISSTCENEGMNTTREPTTFKQNSTSTNECNNAGTTSTAATAALCSVLAFVIIVEGVIVLGLAVALYRAKRTVKSANLYSLAINNTYNSRGMTTRFQDDDTTDDLHESTESRRGDAVNRSMTWSGRNRRRELVPVGSQSMRLPSMTQTEVPPYSQRVLPTPYEEMPSHTFGSPLSVTNPMSILTIEENPYQTPLSEDSAQRRQNLTVSSNHEDTVSNVQEQGMNPPAAEDSDGAHRQFDVPDQEEGVLPERLYQTVASVRDLRQTPTGQENFYQVLESETLQENPYHVVEPDTPFQQENHYHVLESGCTPQEENPYYVLESDDTPEQENPHPVLESDKVPHVGLQDVQGVHNVHEQEDPCPVLESTVQNDPASPRHNTQTSPSLTATIGPKHNTPTEVHTSTEFTISTETDSGCDKNSKTAVSGISTQTASPGCNPKSGATPDNPQITQAQSTPSTNIVHQRPSSMTESVSTTNTPSTPVTKAHSLEESSTGKTEDESKETL